MIRYHLDDLGWYHFEELCQALIKVVFGHNVSSWGGRRDLGRDAYCEFEIKVDCNFLQPPILFQVKFVEGANAAGAQPDELMKSSVNNEVSRINSRISEGTWAKLGTYIFITNSLLKKETRDYICDKITAVCNDCKILILNGKDVCDHLNEFPNIRSSFPEILGLGDLSNLIIQAMAKPAIERSKTDIELVHKKAPRFVRTESYFKALKILGKHSFVVFTGPPEMGKTFNAQIIALSKLTDKWEYYNCLQIEDFLNLYSKEVKQLFIADDAFGSTEYDPTLAIKWARDLHRVLHKLDENHWFIWTSRAAILHQALQRIKLEEDAKPFPDEKEVTVDASALTRLEKAKILYRHCKASNVNDKIKHLIKSRILRICDNPNFTPERIYRLTNKLAIGEIAKIEELDALIDGVINKASDSMSTSFNQLETHYKLFMFSMLNVDPNNYSFDYHVSLFDELCGGSIPEIPHTVANVLNDHFIKIIKGDNGSINIINWLHPSWRDIVIDKLKGSTNERKIFLSKCGIVGIKLALSLSGGEKGERSFPLIRDDSDWDVIQENTNQIVNSQNIEHISEIINILSSMLSWKDKTNYEHQFKLIDYVRNTINNICSSLNVIDIKIPYDVLNRYYKLSIMMKPLPRTPYLDKTWASLFYNDDKALSLNVDPIELVDYILLIYRNEPRFLSQIGLFNKNNQYANVLNTNLSEDILEKIEDDELNTPDVCDEEINKMETLKDRLVELKRIRCCQDELLEPVISEIELYIAYVEELKYELRKEETEYDEMEYPQIPSSEDIIKDLFSDL
jgi:hypothetical protein